MKQTRGYLFLNLNFVGYICFRSYRIEIWRLATPCAMCPKSTPPQLLNELGEGREAKAWPKGNFERHISYIFLASFCTFFSSGQAAKNRPKKAGMSL
jgi:hypothetical protein